MTDFFITLLNMSLTASYVALIVIVVRLFLKRAPRIFSYLLWSVVLFRLVCPISVKSFLSLIPPKAESLTRSSAASQVASAVGGMNLLPGAVGNAAGSASLPQSLRIPVNPIALMLQTAPYLWLCGVVALLLYGVVSYVQLRHRLFAATRVIGNIFETDRIRTPFVFGFFRPKIYIPIGLTGHEAAHILDHEQTHIRRRDHLVKPIAFLAVILHWFNPLIWACYFLMIKDMEMSCDESVMKHADKDIRKSYAHSLLSFSIRQSGLSGTLTFGESHTKSRVRHILLYKRPAFWGILVAALVVLAAVVGLALNPQISILGIREKQAVANSGNQSEVNGSGESSGIDFGSESAPGTDVDSISAPSTNQNSQTTSSGTVSTPESASSNSNGSVSSGNISEETKDYILNGQGDLSDEQRLNWDPTFLNEVDIPSVYKSYLAMGGKSDDIKSFATYLTLNAPIPSNWKTLFEATLWKEYHENVSRYDPLPGYPNFYEVYVQQNDSRSPFVTVSARTGNFHG